MVELQNDGDVKSHKNNWIFTYFGMSLKKDDKNVFFIFIFIQIDISHKYKLHMQLQTILSSFMWLLVVFTKCHERQSYLKSKNDWFG
jgi:hypothetical protein